MYPLIPCGPHPKFSAICTLFWVAEPSTGVREWGTDQEERQFGHFCFVCAARGTDMGGEESKTVAETKGISIWL